MSPSDPDPHLPAGTILPSDSRDPSAFSVHPAGTSPTEQIGANDATVSSDHVLLHPRPPQSDITDLPPELAEHPRYQVLRLLGQGGMGAVYLAQHRKMERLVALKVIHDRWLDNRQTIERFHREVKAASQLNHPHIVTAFDADEAGPAGTIHFLVMEYVEGDSLADYAAAHAPLPIAEACEYVRQAAVGLQAAHERGMVHRDIKPQNLIRSREGQVKILDFGLARLSEPETAPSAKPLTGEGAIMGTADYMAPEQAGEARHADIRADIYSLGCTLYELLTGQVPYPGGSAIQKITRRARDSATPPTELRREIPPALGAIVAKMMARTPDDRYATPGEVAAVLAPFAAGQFPPVETAPPPKSPLVFVAAAAIVLLALAGTVWAFVASSNPLPTPVVAATSAGSSTAASASAAPSAAHRGATSDRPFFETTTPVADPTPGDLPVRAEIPWSADFHELHLADQPTLAQWALDEGKAGYVVKYIAFHVDTGPPRFNAIAVPNPHGVKFQLEFSDERMGVLRDDLQAKGVHLNIMCPIATAEGYRSVGLWTSAYVGIWFARGVPEIILEKMEDKRRFGMRPLSIVANDSEFAVGGRARTSAVVMRRDPGVGWNANLDLPADELPQFIAAARAAGRRLEWLAIHGRRQDRRYSAFAIDNTPSRQRPRPIEWEVDIDITIDQVTSQLAERKKQGYGLEAIASIGGRKTQFVLLWHRPMGEVVTEQ